MPTPTLNLLAEVLLTESELERAQLMLDKKKNSRFGKLLSKSKLQSLQIKLDAQKIRVQAAKEYLEAIAANEK